MRARYGMSGKLSILFPFVLFIQVGSQPQNPPASGSWELRLLGTPLGHSPPLLSMLNYILSEMVWLCFSWYQPACSSGRCLDSWYEHRACLTCQEVQGYGNMLEPVLLALEPAWSPCRYSEWLRPLQSNAGLTTHSLWKLQPYARYWQQILNQ